MNNTNTKRHMPSSREIVEVSQVLIKMAPTIKQQIPQGNSPTFGNIAGMLAEQLGYPVSPGLISKIKDTCGLDEWRGAAGNHNSTCTVKIQSYIRVVAAVLSHMDRTGQISRQDVQLRESLDELKAMCREQM